MKYEYLILNVVFNNEIINSETDIYANSKESWNKLGEQGWKLISVSQKIAYFIKEIY